MTYTMQAVNGLSFGGPITGSPSGTIYTPSGTGQIVGVQLQDVATLQTLGYYVVPSAGANNAAGNAGNGQSAHVTAANGGNATGGNGGLGGDIVLTAGAHGTGGTPGREGLIIVNGLNGAAGLPTSDPAVAGALYSDSGAVTISAG
jgi:hypothetical protein